MRARANRPALPVSGLLLLAMVVTATLSQWAAALEVREIGRSVEGRAIVAHRWNASAEHAAVLVLGAIHGDERESGLLAERLLQRWQAQPALLAGRHVLLVVHVNPDGWAAATRGNARGVDLNRNFPDRWAPGTAGRWDYPGPAPLSEPEARAIHALVAAEPVARVVALHSCRSCGGANNFDGPARRLAALMQTLNGYRVLDEWPMPTPGSFGTFAGKVRRIPTLTLEMPRAGVDAEAMLRNVLAIEAVVQAYDSASPAGASARENATTRP